MLKIPQKLLDASKHRIVSRSLGRQYTRARGTDEMYLSRWPFCRGVADPKVSIDSLSEVRSSGYI